MMLAGSAHRRPSEKTPGTDRGNRKGQACTAVLGHPTNWCEGCQGQTRSEGRHINELTVRAHEYVCGGVALSVVIGARRFAIGCSAGRAVAAFVARW